LKQLCAIVDEEEPDALIISGDIYDSVAPSITAQKLYNRMILELRATAPNMKIIVTAGNHDSSSRLELNGELWNVFDVKIVGYVERNDDGVNYEKHIIEIKNESNERIGYIIAVPYIYYANYPATEDENVNRMQYFHQQLLNRVAERNTGNLPVVLTGHLAVSGANITGHERRNTHLVYENIEDMGNGYDYLALGHIHHPQAVRGNAKARYSGSPIPMSFDESYLHSVSIVEIESHSSAPKIGEREIKPLVPIVTIPKNGESIENIIEEIDTLPKGKSYVRVKLKVKDVIPMSERTQIESRFAGLEAILCELLPVREVTAGAKEQLTLATEEFKQLTPMEIAKDYYHKQFGSEMDEELCSMLAECIEAVNNAQ
jgi:exonuclease SbcD